LKEEFSCTTCGADFAATASSSSTISNQDFDGTDFGLEQTRPVDGTHGKVMDPT
jgi:hypothetical protein